MKKMLFIGSIVLVLGLLIAGFTTPIFAHGPDNDGATLENEEVWEAMYGACEAGDWEAMDEWHAQYDGEEGTMNGGMMGGGMMGNGWDGSQNGWGGMGGSMGGGLIGGGMMEGGTGGSMGGGMTGW